MSELAKALMVAYLESSIAILLGIAGFLLIQWVLSRYKSGYEHGWIDCTIDQMEKSL